MMPLAIMLGLVMAAAVLVINIVVLRLVRQTVKALRHAAQTERMWKKALDRYPDEMEALMLEEGDDL